MPKQTQFTTTTGRTSDRWPISQLQMLSGTMVLLSFTKSVLRYRNGTIFNQNHGFSPNANCPICPCTDSALHILSGCQHTKIRNMIITRHNTASVLIVQALQKGPCGANQIAFTDVGSANKLSEQGLDLRYTANKTLPSWLLPKLTAHALKASSRPDAILF